MTHKLVSSKYSKVLLIKFVVDFIMSAIISPKMVMECIFGAVID